MCVGAGLKFLNVDFVWRFKIKKKKNETLEKP